MDRAQQFHWHVGLRRTHARAGKQAQALVDTIEWTRDNATAKGVWVKDIDNAGNVTYRPGEKQPGWFPFMPSDKVYEAAARDNAEWKQFKKDFVAHWEAQRGPNSTEQALEALRHFIPSLDNGVGGEPLFSPLILPAGNDAARELAQRESHGFLEPVRAAVCTAYVVGREYSERSGREKVVRSTGEWQGRERYGRDYLGRRSGRVEIRGP